MPYPYSLKKIRTLPTEDGGALTADLYRDTLKIGTAEDTGTGGGLWPSIRSAEERSAFTAWSTSLGETHYPAGKGHPAFSVPPSEDRALRLLVTAADDLKEHARLDRASRTKLLYRTAETTEISHYEVALPAVMRGVPLAQVLAAYRPAPWFQAATHVWVTGTGWTDLQTL